MLIFLTFFLAYLILNVYENYYRDQEKLFITTKYAKDYQKLWKHFQFCQWTLVFVYLVILIFKPDEFIEYVKYTNLLITFSLFWTILYDGGLNLLRGLPFFRVSTQTQSFVERNISLLAKFVLLTASIITYLVFFV
ncbi:MAG: hypothetical protein HPY57_13140 [Ignavibacteria bacterium]|nr:hypothetical protein [Ignavibacteria bacterium]